MLVVPALMLLAAIVIGLIPGVVPGIETAASHFHDHASYVRWVLNDAPPHFSPVSHSHVEAFDYLYAGGGTLGALALAGLTLFAPNLHRQLPRALIAPARGALATLRELHSGHIGDYIAWWTAGAAAVGGASLILLR
jgi:multicomponent Na+:H+ antiporter subunit D